MRQVHLDIGEAEKYLGQLSVRIECECGSGVTQVTLLKGNTDSDEGVCRCGRKYLISSNLMVGGKLVVGQRTRT